MFKNLMERQREYELKQQQKQEAKKCPNCGSYKTSSTKGYIVLAGIVIAGMCFLIGMFFPPLLFGSLLGLALLVVAPFSTGHQKICLDCQYKWVVEKEDATVKQL